MSEAETGAVVIRAAGLTKSYRDGVESVDVLRGVDMVVRRGELVAVVGSSGSGKSTLMHCLGGLDTADGGTVEICGEAVGALSESARGALRNRRLGFVYQFHHLLPELTALENVAMPLRIRRMDAAAAEAEARAALEAVGLAHRLGHTPSRMSGGERQRVAIARAMVTRPDCILADEPTGNLDHDTALSIFAGLMEMARRVGTAVVIVTHDREIAGLCDRRLSLEGGRIVDGA